MHCIPFEPLSFPRSKFLHTATDAVWVADTPTRSQKQCQASKKQLLSPFSAQRWVKRCHVQVNTSNDYWKHARCEVEPDSSEMEGLWQEIFMELFELTGHNYELVMNSWHISNHSSWARLNGPTPKKHRINDGDIHYRHFIKSKISPPKSCSVLLCFSFLKICWMVLLNPLDSSSFIFC